MPNCAPAALIAARMESGGEPGLVNISRETHERVKYFFKCRHRGRIKAKNRGMPDMYFIDGIRPGLSRDGEGRVPNEKFHELYEKVAGGAVPRFRSEQNVQ